MSNSVAKDNVDVAHPSLVVRLVTNNVSVPAAGNLRGAADAKVRKLMAHTAHSISGRSGIHALGLIFREIELVRAVVRFSWNGQFLDRTLKAQIGVYPVGGAVPTESDMDGLANYWTVGVNSAYEQGASTFELPISELGPSVVIKGTSAYGQPMGLTVRLDASGAVGTVGKFESKTLWYLKVSRPVSLGVPQSVTSVLAENVDSAHRSLAVATMEPWVTVDSDTSGLVFASPVGYGTLNTLAHLFAEVELVSLRVRTNVPTALLGKHITTQVAIAATGTAITRENIDEQVNFWQVTSSSPAGLRGWFDVPLSEVGPSLLLRGTGAFGDPLGLGVCVVSEQAGTADDPIKVIAQFVVRVSRPI
jgi:hypothetical protein